MLYIEINNETELLTLQYMKKYHHIFHMRVRARAVLLSDKGKSLKLIALMCDTCRQSVSTWLRDWRKHGVCGLYDKPGRGRPRLLNVTLEAEVVSRVLDSPRSLKKVLEGIQSDLGINISKSTLKAACKRAGLRWKRIRKSLRSKRDEEKFRAAHKELKELIKQADDGDIDLVYFDEAGFTLEPCIPYGWQHVNENIEIPSSKSNRLNVLGFMRRNCEFESFVVEGSVTSDLVVACFDAFAKTLNKKTVVVIDNAPVHTSNIFLGNVDKWAEMGLIIKNIPPYSPELNKIEILWRKVKYEWLDFSSYNSFEKLKENLYHVLANIGKKYRIKFA